jgi:pimeloyl-ACP methyl ester carboxylesterase
MTDTVPPPITDVTGGVAGLTAAYAAVRTLAHRFDTAGDRIRACAVADARVLADPDVLESAPLSPLTFAEAEAAVLDAASGFAGAAELGVACEADADAIRTTVALLQECDRLVARSLDAVDRLVAADLDRLYPSEGAPVVRRRPDLGVPLAATPPADLTGLIRHLQETNDLSPAGRPGDQGTLEVQTLHAPDGTVRHIVYLPGTDDLATPPWQSDDDARDLAADLRVIAGADTTYADGIRQAMREAGIGPHDPVLLVGHSLGGMEAASLLAHGSGFDVTHVVTAGSPIAGVHGYPAGSHVLSLENHGDVVPLLDGHDNPDSLAQVTVTFDDHESSIAANHALEHYVDGAAAADASTDPSIREQLASLRAAGFLGAGGTATSQVLQVTR